MGEAPEAPGAPPEVRGPNEVLLVMYSMMLEVICMVPRQLRVGPRGVQLSTTDIFCQKMENTVILSTVFRVYPKSRILDFSDVVLNSMTFF